MNSYFTNFFLCDSGLVFLTSLKLIFKYLMRNLKVYHKLFRNRKNSIFMRNMLNNEWFVLLIVTFNFKVMLGSITDPQRWVRRLNCKFDKRPCTNHQSANAFHFKEVLSYSDKILNNVNVNWTMTIFRLF